MSAGAVFKLIANDGKADRMIMATKLLNQRIKDVMCVRRKAGKSDITPTLTDLERTHILYVNAHFKPFAAIGYEYNKVRPQSGNPTLGGGVTFSIPQFGDFFHDMVCRTRLGGFMGNPGLTPLQGSAAFPNNGIDPFGSSDDSYFYNIVDAFGNVLVQGGQEEPTQLTYRNFVRYCEFPGNRLHILTKFDVNGNPLDQYDQIVPVMLEKFCTPPNKRVGHDRLLGQEVPLTGYGHLCTAVVTDADAANTPAGIGKANAGQSNQSVGLFVTGQLSEGTPVLNRRAQAPRARPAPRGRFGKPFTGHLGAAEEDEEKHDSSAALISGGTSDTVVGQTSIANLNAFDDMAQYDVSRELKQFVNGPQTPKPVQAALEIWNKLRFWFNDDVRLSVASVSIPFGQRYITIDMAPQNYLAFEYPSIFLETIQDPATSPTGGPTNQRKKTYTPIFQKFGTTEIAIERMELYINNIFVNPEINMGLKKYAQKRMLVCACAA